MRKLGIIILMVGMLLSTISMLPAAEFELKGTITLSGAWAVYPTAVAWAEAFQKAYPKVKIDVSAGGAGKGAADVIAGFVDIGMVSREPDPAETARGVLPIYILHDAVYPVVSGKNPALGALLKKGVKKQAWADMYITGSATTWDAVVGGEQNHPLHVYTRSDSCGAAASWAKYLGKKQEDLKGIGVYGDPGLLETAKKDPAGIGYANFSYVFTREGTPVEGAKIVPIDANENGLADPDEIFETRSAAIKAIEQGTYPVTRKNYFFTKGKPGALAKVFIAFCLSDDGTKIVDTVGTSLPLPQSERAQSLSALE